MEKKLRIYTPNHSFKVDKRLLTLSFLWSVVFLIYLTKSKFPSDEENLELLGFVFVIITILYSLYFMISNFFICETTNGQYSGNLIIDSEKITCNLDVYTIYYIEIYKKNGAYKKYFFLQTKTENMRMFSDELRTYYRFGKLGEQNYKNLVE